MTENNSEIKPINEFYLSNLYFFLINKKMNNKYKLVEIKDSPIKKIMKKKKKRMRKKIEKITENFLDKIQILFNSINRLNIHQLKGILDVIDVKKEGIEQKGFFELDISKLDKGSFKKLKDYVENCKRTKNYV